MRVSMGIVLILSAIGLVQPHAQGDSIVIDHRGSPKVVRLSTIPVIGATSVAVDEQANRVFVSSVPSIINTINAQSGKIVHRAVVGESPFRIAVATGAGRVFVPTNVGTYTLDAQTGRVFITTMTTIDVLDARTGALIHSTNVATTPASTPVVNLTTGHVVVLLTSPRDVRTAQVDGPGVLLALDASRGAIRQRVDAGHVLPAGMTDVIAADARAKRVFVLNENGVSMYDATRL